MFSYEKGGLGIKILELFYKAMLGKWIWRLKFVKLVCGGENDVWFNKMVEWRMGDGKLTRFWEDAWVGEGSLQKAFLRVFLN